MSVDSENMSGTNREVKKKFKCLACAKVPNSQSIYHESTRGDDDCIKKHITHEHPELEDQGDSTTKAPKVTVFVKNKFLTLFFLFLFFSIQAPRLRLIDMWVQQEKTFVTMATLGLSYKSMQSEDMRSILKLGKNGPTESMLRNTIRVIVTERLKGHVREFSI